MGYDKPDLGFVVHVGAPPSPVSYYQQVGRAGRAIEHAHAVLLPSDADSGVWEYFATATIPVPEQVRAVLDVLDRSPGEPLSVVAIEAQSSVRRGRVELMLKQLAVDGVVDRVEGGWLGTCKPWSYDHEHYDGVVAVRRREADIMRAYVRGERCLMELLQESLDDPAAEPCGRCSVCRGGLPEALGAAPSPETVATVTGLLRGQVHVLEPRKMWPGGAFGSRGRIPADEAHDPGRTLVFADAPEWRETVATLFARDAPGSRRGHRRLRPPARAVAHVVAGPPGGGRRPDRRPGRRADDRLGGRPPRLGGAPGPGHAGRAGPRARPARAELLGRGGVLARPPRRGRGGRRRSPAARCCWSWTPPRRCGR